MRVTFLFFVLGIAGCAWAAEPQQGAFETGRARYLAGEFRQAASYFQRAVRQEPDNAPAHFWLGKSYAVLADIGYPLSSGATAKAHRHLARAVALAPENTQYRRELFEFLVSAADFSSAGLHEAEQLIETAAISDPERRELRFRLEEQRLAASSANHRLASLFLFVPAQINRILEKRPPLLLPDAGSGQ